MANAQINVTFITNRRRGRNLAFNGYIYPVNHGTDKIFHFTRAVWRKAQITGLQIPYREDDNVKKLIRRAAVLLLDPLDSIEDVWFQALEDRDEADLTELTETFTDYVTEQWVNGDRLVWNHFGSNRPQTNNNIEA